MTTGGAVLSCKLVRDKLSEVPLCHFEWKEKSLRRGWTICPCNLPQLAIDSWRSL